MTCEYNPHCQDEVYALVLVSDPVKPNSHRCLSVREPQNGEAYAEARTWWKACEAHAIEAMAVCWDSVVPLAYVRHPLGHADGCGHAARPGPCQRCADEAL